MITKRIALGDLSLDWNEDDDELVISYHDDEITVYADYEVLSELAKDLRELVNED